MIYVLALNVLATVILYREVYILGNLLWEIAKERSK
jgi:hypothetical protein